MHHYDFRLEMNGALKSWAVPKGIPEADEEKHLAIEVPDHPLDYVDFEGKIPAGMYGAVSVQIWDHGFYDLHEWVEDKIVFTLHGGRVQGKYALVAFPKSGAGHWLLMKTQD